jgi:RHS repeat-associated protein
MLPVHWMPQSDPMIPPFRDVEVKNGIQAPHVAPNPEKERFRHKSNTVNALRRCCTPKKTGGVTVYGYRHYTPKTGQFLRRDPIQELGGMNLYGFVGNDGAGKFDTLGLAVICCCCHEEETAAFEALDYYNSSKESYDNLLKDLRVIGNAYANARIELMTELINMGADSAVGLIAIQQLPNPQGRPPRSFAKRCLKKLTNTKGGTKGNVSQISLILALLDATSTAIDLHEALQTIKKLQPALNNINREAIMASERLKKSKNNLDNKINDLDLCRLKPCPFTITGQ